MSAHDETPAPQVGCVTRRRVHPLLWLLGLALLVRVIAALFLTQPGYMDAYYYYNAAESLARGQGLTDHVLWNYLNNPPALPQPACLYWMPLTALVISPFLWLLGNSFRAAQVPLVVLSVALVWLTYRVSLDFFAHRPGESPAAGEPLPSGKTCAVLAAIWAIFAGFYTAFWATTDSFALFALTAGLALYAIGRGLRNPRPLWFVLAGGFAGLAHLTRADGLLALIAALLALGLLAWRRPHERARLASMGLYAVLLYLAVMAPWFYRNWRETGGLLGGGLQTLFLRDYDELFSYGRELSFASYLEWGGAAILQSKLQALWFGVQNLIAVNLMIFLTPFAVCGLWARRKRVELLPFALYAVLLYVTMTLLFTFPGMRGGLFHSSTALLPWLFAAAACGLREFVRFMSARRASWDTVSAYRFFAVAYVLLAACLSGVLFWNKVAGRSGPDGPWNEQNVVYNEVGDWLAQHGQDGAPVLVNNAPAFYYFVHRPALSIPNEAPDTVVEAGRRYGAGFLILEADHPRPLRGLYRGQEAVAGLELVHELKSAHSSGSGGPVKVYRLEQSR